MSKKIKKQEEKKRIDASLFNPIHKFEIDKLKTNNGTQFIVVHGERVSGKTSFIKSVIFSNKLTRVRKIDMKATKPEDLSKYIYHNKLFVTYKESLYNRTTTPFLFLIIVTLSSLLITLTPSNVYFVPVIVMLSASILFIFFPFI